MVRVAAVDASGEVLNEYPHQAALAGPEPAVPYAVHLGANGREYGLLGFDLDATRGPVLADLGTLTRLLDAAGVPYLVARSGPSDGRHVWVRPQVPVSAATVRQLAHGLRRLLPTLDISPLCNPVTGALRPPGAPHRAGGTSEILSGSLEAFQRAAASTEQLSVLVETVARSVLDASDAVGVGEAALRSTPLIAHDEDGHPFIPGPKRALPAGAQRALQTVLAPGDDASGAAWAVLCGAARAHWQLADVAALMPSAPGLEHLRSTRPKLAGRTPTTPARRLPRTPVDRTRHLARQWQRAVDEVVATTNLTGGQRVGDATFTGRCQQLAAAIEAVQDRAGACPGRWAQDGGAADRLVLDALCELELDAVQPSVEASIRQLALMCGIGRSTADRALDRLQADGWITAEAPATGPAGARWAVVLPPPAGLSTDLNSGGSQADPRPAAHPGSSGLSARDELRHRLHTRRLLHVHDIFTPGGLGHDAAAIWARLHTGTPIEDLPATTGYPSHLLAGHLDRLYDEGLWRWNDHVGRTETDSAARVSAAHRLGVHGVLVDRHLRYQLEREQWAWWLEHVEWLRTPRAQKRTLWRRRVRGRAGVGQTAIAVPGLTAMQRYGPYPRTADGRGDHRAARSVIAAARAAATIRAA